MSENVSKLEFNFDKNTKSKKLEFKTLLEEIANTAKCSEFDIKISGSEYMATYGFCELDKALDLESTFLKFKDKGVKNLLCKIWSEQSDEELIYKFIGEKLECFDSLKDLESFEKEVKNISTESFNFDKVGNEKTVLIKLQIKAKKKRAVLLSLFESALLIKTEKDYDIFDEKMGTFNTSKEHDLGWAGFKWKDDNSWNVGYEDIIYGLKFVVEQDAFLYLGFNLDCVDVEIDEWGDGFSDFAVSFEFVNGISKAWIKYRPKKSESELYTYHPGMGDAPPVIEQPKTEDNDWPKK